MTLHSTHCPSVLQTFRLIAARLCVATLLCGASALSAAAQEPPLQPEPGAQTTSEPADATAAPDTTAPQTSDDPAAAVSSTDTPATPAPVAPAVRLSPSGHIAGHIWRMSPGLVFLRTPIGLLTLSCKTCLRDLKGNPTITIDVHGADGAVTVTPHGGGRAPQTYLWGPLPSGTSGRTGSLTRWTPDGEQHFTTDRVAARLAGIPAGQSVTLDAANGAVTGVHDLHVDLQISQLPAPGAATEFHMSGPVTKVKNGYVHVQTHLGDIPVSAKLGLCAAKNQCQVKAGDQLSVTVRESAAAIDLTAGGASAPTTRLLLGKLSYTGPDKQSLSLWTPSGHTTVPAERGRGSLASLKEGAPIIVELDGAGAVREIRKGN